MAAKTIDEKQAAGQQTEEAGAEGMASEGLGQVALAEEEKVGAAEGQPGEGVDASSVETVDMRQLAFEEMQGEIGAVRGAELASRRVDMQRAATAVQTVALRDSAPPRRAEFERVASVGLYNLGLLVRLIKLSLAAWYVREM